MTAATNSQPVIGEIMTDKMLDLITGAFTLQAKPFNDLLRPTADGYLADLDRLPTGGVDLTCLGNAGDRDGVAFGFAAAPPRLRCLRLRCCRSRALARRARSAGAGRIRLINSYIQT
jgi:hypothetical protein